MKNIAEKLAQITCQSAQDSSKFEQISKFTETLRGLQELVFIDKPTYIFPQVDTIGRQVHISLNKK